MPTAGKRKKSSPHSVIERVGGSKGEEEKMRIWESTLLPIGGERGQAISEEFLHSQGRGEKKPLVNLEGEGEVRQHQGKKEKRGTFHVLKGRKV